MKVHVGKGVRGRKEELPFQTPKLFGDRSSIGGGRKDYRDDQGMIDNVAFGVTGETKVDSLNNRCYL